MPTVIEKWEHTYQNIIDSYVRGEFPVKDRIHLTQILAMLKEIKIHLHTSIM